MQGLHVQLFFAFKCNEAHGSLTSIAKRGRRPLAGKRAHTRGAADCDCHRKLLAPLSAYRQNQIKAPNAAHSHAPAARKGLIILCPRQSQTKAEEAWAGLAPQQFPSRASLVPYSPGENPHWGRGMADKPENTLLIACLILGEPR